MPINKKHHRRDVETFLTAASQARPFPDCKHIPTALHNPHCSTLADLFFRHAAQYAQCAFIGMIRQEATIVRRQTADDVSTTGSAVSGVFDGVGLIFVSKMLILLM